MDDAYDNLVRLATQGSKAALAQLFALAEKLRAEHRLEDAAQAFRDSAIAYRIAAFRNTAQKEDAERRGQSLATVVEIYRRWVEANPNGMRQLPRASQLIDSECIRRVIVDELHNDQTFAPVFAFLFEALSSLGMEFYSPGGSLQRRVWGLLEIVFGLAASNHYFARYLEDRSVRIGIDLLADEVERRNSRRSF